MHVCPTSDQLDRFCCGATLPSPELDAIAEHLSVCESCSTLFHQSFIAQTSISRGTSPSAGPASSSFSASSNWSKSPNASTFEHDDWPPPAFLDAHPQWEILELLGGGGMGAVYLARDRTVPSRVVAIKILRSGLTSKRAFFQRFQREIEIMKTMGKHPNLVSIIATEEVAGQPLLITEYVEGLSLTQVMQASELRRVEWQHAVDLILQVLIGLDFVWQEHCLVHRDIKPSNLMLTTTSTVKILDFGLAKLREVNQADSLTATAISAGTPAYCSPEQDGDFKQAGFQADLYSVGCTLFELITGSQVFGDETGHKTPVAVRMAHHQQAPRRLSKMVAGLPRGIERHVFRLLAKQPEQRFQTYRDAIQAFLPYASAAGVRSVEKSKPAYLVGSVAKRPLARYQPIAWALSLVMIVILGGWLLVNPTMGELQIVLDNPDVTIVINGEKVDDQNSKVEQSGEAFALTLKLPAGVSEVEVRLGNEQRQTQRVKITGNAVTQIRFEFSQPAEPSAVAMTVGGANTAINNEQPRTARLLRHSGRWAIEEDVLCHYDGEGEQWLVFGDPTWTDYDYSFEARHVGFPSGLSALFRSPQDEQVTLFSFGWIDFYTAQVRKRVDDDFFVKMPPPDGPYFKRLNWKIQADIWYSVKVKVRGQRADCFVDDVLIFTVTRVPFDRGRVGVRTWRRWSGKSEFKNFKVIDPAGKQLWSGLPDLPEAAF